VQGTVTTLRTVTCAQVEKPGSGLASLVEFALLWGRAWCCTSVIPAMREAEVGGSPSKSGLCESVRL
jgi:hypothetical protein